MGPPVGFAAVAGIQAGAVPSEVKKEEENTLSTLLGRIISLTDQSIFAIQITKSSTCSPYPPKDRYGSSESSSVIPSGTEERP